MDRICAGRTAVSAGLVCVILLVAVMSEGRASDVALAVLIAAAAVMLAAPPGLCRTFRSDDRTVSVRTIPASIYAGMFAALERRFPLLVRCRTWNERALYRLVPRTGTAYDAQAAATRHTRASVLVMPGAALAGAFLGTGVHALLYAVAMLPVLVYLWPNIMLYGMVAERRSRIEEEMAYFLSYVDVMQTVGAGLYRAFHVMRGQGILPGVERDASEIVKRVELLGMTQAESLEAYAQSHPSRGCREFIYGYLAKLASVGNVPAYTEAKARYFFDEYLGSWARYERSAHEIFGAVIMIAMVLPMMMAFNSIMGTASSGMLLIIGMVITPAVALAMTSMLDSSQPSTGGRHPVAYPTLAAGAVAGLAAYLAGMGLPASVSIGCLTGSLANHAVVRPGMERIREIDAMVPEFMSDVVEMSRTGRNIGQMVTAQVAAGRYGGPFGDLLAGIAARIRAGIPFPEAARAAGRGSMHARFVLFLLGRTYVTGGGSTEMYMQMARFVTAVHQTRGRITRSLGIMTVLIYVVPFMMLGISHVMVGMFSGTDAAGPGIRVDGSILDGISLMAVTTSVPMGVVAAKISTYTVRNTLPVAVSSAVALAAIHAVPWIAGMAGA